MRILFSILILFIGSAFCTAQEMPVPPIIVPDTTKTIQEQEAIADTVLTHYNTMYEPIDDEILGDTAKRIHYWRITERIGEMIKGKPDTILTDFPNRQLVEGHGVAMEYLGNLGLPAQSRVYFEQQDRSNFMFMDNYRIYTKSPETFNFINTKIPYSNISYISGGSSRFKEERFTGALSINFGKKINVGFDLDYLYARGFYNSQGAKHFNSVFYGSYIADRHRLHVFINPMNATNAENGGIINDLFITDPASIDSRSIQTNDIPTVMSNTWNEMKVNRYFMNYRYNLGFERETEKVDTLGNKIKQFIPVSSIIYTFDYSDNFRKFYSNDTLNLDTLYRKHYYENRPLADSTSYWKLRNTVALSLREGFSNWAKFDLTAFITNEIRNFTLITENKGMNEDFSQNSTYIGGEIAKRKGKILRYNARGDFGILGHNLGDFNVIGNIETRIPVLKKTATITASGYIKNFAPSFYENTFRSKYFWWDNSFGKTRKVFAGGTLDIPHTKTNISFGVENVSNYIYFDTQSLPNQHSDNIQILAASLQQNFQLGILHWNNQLTYQQSSNKDIIPLPDLSLYSSLFIQFKVAKVLTVQMGGNVHYFTKYYAPTYEPVTQQFHLQTETEVGNYPLVNAFINCHLKYTRFFIEFYNLSSSFIARPEYFSAPHYPIDPQIVKWGLSWDFNN